MGQRANFVIVRDGEYTLHYSHYAANSFDADMFWGPDHFSAFVQAQEQTENWLDNTWAEGGALVDFDTSTLLWFGGIEDLCFEPAYRRIFCQVFPHNWPGWTVRWVTAGLNAFVDHLGLDRSLVAASQSPRSPTSSHRKPPSRILYVDKANQELGGFPGTLLSLRSTAGLAVVPVLGSVEELLEPGPGLIDVASRRHKAANNNANDELPLSDPSWVSRTSAALDLPELPLQGIHIDLTNHSLAWWTGRRPTRSLDTKAWANWTQTDWFDDFDEHLNLLGGRVTIGGLRQSELTKRMVNWLMRHGGEDYAGVFGSTVEALQVAGHDVSEVNPLTASHAPVDAPNHEAKTEIIARALAAAGLAFEQ